MVVFRPPRHLAHPFGISRLVQTKAPPQEPLQKILSLRGLAQRDRRWCPGGRNNRDQREFPRDGDNSWGGVQQPVPGRHQLSRCFQMRDGPQVTCGTAVREESETAIAPFFSLSRNT